MAGSLLTYSVTVSLKNKHSFTSLCTITSAAAAASRQIPHQLMLTLLSCLKSSPTKFNSIASEVMTL